MQRGLSCKSLTAWLCFRSLHSDGTSVFMRCIFCCDKSMPWVSAWVPFTSFVVEQPQLSNSLQIKESPPEHIMCLITVSSSVSLHIILLSCFLYFEISHSSHSPRALSPWPIPQLLCFFWYSGFTVRFGVISHQILLFSVSCSGGLAALFTGFLLLPCTTGPAAYHKRANAHCARHFFSPRSERFLCSVCSHC